MQYLITNLLKKICPGPRGKVCAEQPKPTRRGRGDRSQYFEPELALIVLL